MKKEDILREKYSKILHKCTELRILSEYCGGAFPHNSGLRIKYEYYGTELKRLAELLGKYNKRRIIKECKRRNIPIPKFRKEGIISYLVYNKINEQII